MEEIKVWCMPRSEFVKDLNLARADERQKVLREVWEKHETIQATNVKVGLTIQESFLALLKSAEELSQWFKAKLKDGDTNDG